jgi:DNA repair protein RadC
MNIREVHISYGTERAIDCETIRSAEKAAKFMRTVAPDNSREHVIALYLDGANKPIAYSLIATGSATECTVHAREIFQRAIAVGARFLILAHNHPSQEITPSKEDYMFTMRIKECGDLLGIRLLDHIVFSDSKHYSYQEEGKV